MKNMVTLLSGALLCFPLLASEINLGHLATGVSGFDRKVTSIAERKFAGVVRQETDFSCGAAAVATILTYSYNLPSKEQWVVDSMLAMANPELVSRYGFSMLDMKNYVEMIGLEARGYEIGEEALKNLLIPAIVLLNLDGYQHFVVLRRVDNQGRVYISDPALGNRVIKMDEFLSGWNNIILAIVGPGYDKDSILANPPPPLSVRRVGSHERFSPVSDAALLDFGFSHKDLM